MSRSPLILCLETSTKNCSVAIFESDDLLILKEDYKETYSHSENLHSFIDSCLCELKISPEQLSAIAVSSGPGSYTGLRVGASAAKGLCFALNVPLISVSSLQTIARHIRANKGDMIISVIDARRMEIYGAVHDSQYKEIISETNLIITADSFNEFKTQTCHFVGTGVAKIESVITLPSVTFLEHCPSAKNMIFIAIEKYHQKLFEDVAYFVPNYLKPYVVQKQNSTKK